ncbi:sulfotransferase family cytosolic 1B member 1-like [Drosophila serrata]|uniref:sulfotransferase family cytosolic 1B member 1-like n=1 Tax=Drosophila serrata TaxID=7274 RepID=UPI000A1D2A91|nr:sulfotransferase family cytosolic 1B member 1-like [Drosophila serrata]
MPLIQLQYKGSKGLGPNWLPLKQDWSKRWCTLPEKYNQEFAKRIDEFKTKDGDVYVVTFMKSGTTWMQELAWLLLNNLDYERAKTSHTVRRSPHIEYSCINNKFSVDNISLCDQMQDNPRFIKSHLPSQLLPRQIWEQKRKIIYVARNPKDVVISSFHFLTSLGLWQGNLQDYIDEYITDRIPFTSYWSHIIDFYRMRNETNVFFVTYEEMKQDLKVVIERLSKFLDCKKLNEMEMETLFKHLSFDNMKENKYTNPTKLIQNSYNAKEDFNFMRRGIVGSYRDELNPEQINKLDRWTQDYLQEYGINEADIFGNI